MQAMIKSVVLFSMKQEHIDLVLMLHPISLSSAFSEWNHLIYYYIQIYMNNI